MSLWNGIGLRDYGGQRSGMANSMLSEALAILASCHCPSQMVSAACILVGLQNSHLYESGLVCETKEVRGHSVNDIQCAS